LNPASRVHSLVPLLSLYATKFRGGATPLRYGGHRGQGAISSHINLSKIHYRMSFLSNNSFVSAWRGLLVRVGVHVSIAGKVDQAPDRAKELGCDMFQMFTRNPRGWKFKKLNSEEVRQFRQKAASYGLAPIVTHMPYLPNLSSPRKVIYNQSVRSLSAEMGRCAELGIPYIVTHLGSHLGKGADIGLKNIVSAINIALSQNDSSAVMLLLENTAGTKNSMGSSFEDIRRILDRIKQNNRIGLCFDTAHAFAAGYDLRTSESVNETLLNFDKVLGIERLKVIHLNDSKGELGSGRDRHEHIGLGHIGEVGFRAIVKHQFIRDRPLILETPIDNRRDELGNLRRVRELAQ